MQHRYPGGRQRRPGERRQSVVRVVIGIRLCLIAVREAQIRLRSRHRQRREAHEAQNDECEQDEGDASVYGVITVLSVVHLGNSFIPERPRLSVNPLLRPLPAERLISVL